MAALSSGESGKPRTASVRNVSTTRVLTVDEIRQKCDAVELATVRAREAIEVFEAALRFYSEETDAEIREEVAEWLYRSHEILQKLGREDSSLH